MDACTPSERIPRIRISSSSVTRSLTKPSVARIAIGLRDLPQDLFDKVVAGDISEEIGSAIGKGGLPEQVLATLDRTLRRAEAARYDRSSDRDDRALLEEATMLVGDLDRLRPPRNGGDA